METFISDNEDKKKLGDSWFEKLVGELTPSMIEEYKKLRELNIKDILNNKQEQSQIKRDIDRAQIITKNRKEKPLISSKDDLIRLEYIQNILTKKLMEKYGKNGSYLQTYTTMGWILYSYIGDKNQKIIDMEVSVTDKEIKTYLILYKIICGIEENYGLMNSSRRDNKRKEIIDNITIKFLKKKLFRDTYEEVILYVTQEITKCEDGVFGAFASFAVNGVNFDKSELYYLEKFISKSIINKKFNNMICLYYIKFIFLNKIKNRFSDPNYSLMDNFIRNFFKNYYLNKDNIDEYLATIKPPGTNHLCRCKSIGGRKKRKRKTKKRKKRTRKKRKTKRTSGAGRKKRKKRTRKKRTSGAGRKKINKR